MKTDFKPKTIDLITSKPKQKVFFYIDAFRKMKRLVKYYDKEVRWRGVAYRKGDNAFLIKDILVYPQQITSRSVTVDPVKYGEWFMSLPDEEYEHLRFQGHSHVNMPSFPSGIDQQQMNDAYETLRGDDFFIHIILNKENKYWIQIYDKKTNIYYKNKDIEVIVEHPTILSFLDNNKEKIEGV